MTISTPQPEPQNATSADNDSVRDRPFSAKYRHRAWGIVLAIPAGLVALFAVGYFIASVVAWDSYYLPAAITFLIPALGLGLPAVYLLRGRVVDPRPAARREAAAQRRENAATQREARTAAQQAARQEELTVKRQTAEAQRQAAVAQRDAAHAELQAAEERRLASDAERRAATATAPDTPAQPDTALPAPAQWAADKIRIDRIAGYVRTSGVLWLVLGILQVLIGAGLAFLIGFTLTLVVIGIWNILAAAGRLASVKLIKNRDSTIPASWEGIAGLIIFGVANFLIGGVIGVALVIFDFFIRDQIMKNRALFTQLVAAS